jgi:hypothetical protein
MAPSGGTVVVTTDEGFDANPVSRALVFKFIESERRFSQVAELQSEHRFRNSVAMLNDDELLWCPNTAFKIDWRTGASTGVLSEAANSGLDKREYALPADSMVPVISRDGRCFSLCGNTVYRSHSCKPLHRIGTPPFTVTEQLFTDSGDRLVCFGDHNLSVVNNLPGAEHHVINHSRRGVWVLATCRMGDSDFAVVTSTETTESKHPDHLMEVFRIPEDPSRISVVASYSEQDTHHVALSQPSSAIGVCGSDASRRVLLFAGAEVAILNPVHPVDPTVLPMTALVPQLPGFDGFTDIDVSHSGHRVVAVYNDLTVESQPQGHVIVLNVGHPE